MAKVLGSVKNPNQIRQVTPGEKASGTETGIRHFSPKDVVDISVTHGGGGGGGSSYTHPTHPGDDIDIDTGALTGAVVISDLDFNVTTDTQGHVTDANATVSTRTLTAANLGVEEGATADQTGAEIKAAYEGEADTNAYTDAEKSKLAGIESNATADQTNSEIEAGYNAQVAQVSSGEKTAGTSTAVRRFSPKDVADMAGIHGGGGGASLLNENTMASQSTTQGAVQASIIEFVRDHSFVNLLANSHFMISQSGDTFTSPSSGSYLLDLFKYYNTTSGNCTVTRETGSGPTVASMGRFFESTIKFDITTAESSLEASDYMMWIAYIEGYDFQQIAQRPFYVKFPHKHSVAGTYAVAFRNEGADRYFIAEYTQSTANTWEMAEILVPASPDSGTWRYDHEYGISIAFVIASDSGGDYEGTVGSWQTGNKFSSTNQVNGVSSTSNSFEWGPITIGNGQMISVAPNYQQALAHVQRYYVHALEAGATGYATGANQTDRCMTSVTYPSPMRIEPSFSYTNNGSTNTTGSLLQRSATDRKESCTYGFKSNSSGSMFWRGYLNLDARH